MQTQLISLPNNILFRRERENFILKMIVSLSLSLFSLVGINAQPCNFTTSINGCSVVCTPTGLPQGALVSWITGGCPAEYANSGPPNYVATFTVKPEDLPCLLTVTLSAFPNPSCTQTIPINPSTILNITPSVKTNYNNNTLTVSYKVCNTGNAANTSPIDLNLLPQSGLTYVSGSFFQENFNINANSLTPNSCITATATYSAVPALACNDWEVGMRAISNCTAITGNYQNVKISSTNTIGTVGGTTLVSSLPSNAFDNNPTIEGQLIFDTPNSFLFAKNLWMKPNSSITVNPKIGLILLGSNIRGCEMWHGIQLQNLSSMKIGTSKIEDAEIAIQLDAAMLTTTDKTEFNHNRIAIIANPLAGLNIDKTVFDGGTLKDNTEAVTGILLNATNLVNYVTNNSFLNYAQGTGIDANNFGQLILKKNRFVNNNVGINAKTNAKTTSSSIGVLEIEGFGKTPQTNFENCKYGIQSSNTFRNLITLNNISNVLYGVYLNNPRRGQVNANTINSKEAGIWVVGENKETFYTNQNTMTAPTGSGIRFWGSKTSKGQYFAQNNIITLMGISYSPVGISVTNMNTAICNNIISINGTNSTGINLDQTRGFYGSNSVTGTTIKSNTGIQTTMSTTKQYDNRMYRNSVENTKIGTRFNGSSPTDFILNSHNTHTYGLYLDNVAVIGNQPADILKQTPSGNEWQGNYANYAAFHEDINSDQYKKSTFYYNNVFKSTYLAAPLHSAQQDWFEPNSKTTISNPANDCKPTTIIAEVNPNTDDFIKSLIDGSLYPPTPRGKTQLWIAERQLYDLLKAANYSEGQFANLDAFLANNSPSSAKLFFDLAEQIKTIKNIPTALQTEIDERSNQLLQQYQLLSALDSAFHYNSIQQRPISPTFWTTRSTINTNISAKKSILQDIDSHLAEAQATQATILKEINNQIICNEIYEANERDVNSIILDRLINQQDSFDVNQEDVLTHIALQCPEDGGWAVFEARSILAQKYNYEYDFDAICGKTIISKTQKTYSYNTLTIAPNPIKEEFTVFIAQNDDTQYDRIQIIDMYGRSIYSAVISDKAKAIRINSATFANGSYQCVLFENGTALARQKLFKVNQ